MLHPDFCQKRVPHSKLLSLLLLKTLDSSTPFIFELLEFYMVYCFVNFDYFQHSITNKLFPRTKK